MNELHPSSPQDAPKWRPLNRVQRRVLGVLIEKAKTTPDAYPMTLNALTNGCNQKSNRSPQMNLSPEQVQSALDELREMAAVAEVQSGGRTAKYRHYGYDWLGVDKREMAVITELLLRGEQTVGELRARASRMEQIADLAELRALLGQLIDKRLVISLTPEGRGQVVTHALYEPQELEKVRQRTTHVATDEPTGRAATVRSAPEAGAELAQLRQQIEQLEQAVQQLQQRLEQLESSSSPSDAVAH